MRSVKCYTNRGRSPSNPYSLDNLKRDFGFVPGMCDPQDDPEDNADKITKLKRVMREIINQELTNIQRDIILDCLSGKTQREIAMDRGIHESTVSRHHKKAMKTLKRFGAYIAPFLR